MAEFQQYKYLTHYLLIVAFSVTAMLPMVFFGIPSGNDFSQNFQRAVTIHNSISAGVLSPGWGATTNNGLGDLAVRFYPPLVYYEMSGFTFLFGDWYTSTLAAYLAIFFIGGFGAYLWAREAFSKSHALFAAALFTFAPYHLNLIYNNGLIAEFAATAVIPFCIYFVSRVSKRKNLGGVIGLAMSLAALVLVNLPSSIIVSISLAFYAVFLNAGKRKIAPLVRPGISALLGIALSSFYWARMLPELDWVKHSGEKYFSGIYDYRRNFLLTPENWLGNGEDSVNLWPADLMLLAMVLIGLPSIYYLLRTREKPTAGHAAVAGLFAFGIFMATPLSYFAWQYVTILHRVQFPWRFLGVISLSGAVLGSDVLVRFSRAMKQNRPSPVAVGLGLGLAFFTFTSVFLVKGAVFLKKGDFISQISQLASAASYEGWQPVWADGTAGTDVPRVTAEGREIALSTWTATDRSFTVAPGQAAVVQIGTFYYPWWHAVVNGVSVPVEKNQSGLINIFITSDLAKVDLTFREPTYVTAAQITSSILWMAMLAMIVMLLIGWLSRSTNNASRNFSLSEDAVEIRRSVRPLSRNA